MKHEFSVKMDRPRAASRGNRRKLILPLSIATGLLVVAGGTVFLRGAAPTIERQSLWFGEVKYGTMVRETQGAGQLIAHQLRWITATTAARIEAIRAQPGTAVTADSVLLQLSNPELELAALEAERQVFAARAALTQLEATQQQARLSQQSTLSTLRGELDEAQRRSMADASLASRGFLSELEHHETKGRADALTKRVSFEEKRLAALARGTSAQFRAQQSEVERLVALAKFRRDAVEQLGVRAGVEGILQEVLVQPGQWVTPGTVLAKVATSGPLVAQIFVPESQASELQRGQHATVTIVGLRVPAEVRHVDPAVQNGRVRVELTLTGEPPPSARPELSVEATIEIAKLENTLFIDRPGFAVGEKQFSLFKLAANGVDLERVTVERGATSAKSLQILSGLKAGDRVVLTDLTQWERVQTLRLE